MVTADPKARLKWAGPDMSARSSITARLMETWAHGQEVYDHLGVQRVDADRIKNIAHLGVSTFGWTYMVRKMAVPTVMPRVELTAPSGEAWSWGETGEFCHRLGERILPGGDASAERGGYLAGGAWAWSRPAWMGMAQRFAGAAEPPPAPGTRYRRAR